MSACVAPILFGLLVLYHCVDVLNVMPCVGLQAAAQCYIDLIIKESDNNVKLIVLDRLIELKEHPTHERVLQVCGLKRNRWNVFSVNS